MIGGRNKEQIKAGTQHRECGNSQFKDHVVETVAAVCFEQADDVWMFQTQAYTSLTLQIYANSTQTQHFYISIFIQLCPCFRL